MKQEMTTSTLKLNYKRTFYIGFAFFTILMIWQLYNHYSPLFLESLLQDRFPGQKEQMYYLIGIIMACDNLFAIFMLPIFGALSDKTNTRWGRRMPYIIFGMFATALIFPLIALMFINETLIGLIVMMGIILIIMNIYRNPAVALMPDVTPKPLRAKANGIINFVGYLGAILAGGLAIVLKIGKRVNNEYIINQKNNALIAFIIGSFFMLLALVLLLLKINENKLIEETKADLALGEKLSQTIERTDENKPLSPIDRRNFIIILFSVLFWFISFNAIETFNSLFCAKILGDDSINGTIVIVMTVSSIITFLASMNLSLKIGRKMTVLIGLVLIILGFAGIIILMLASGAFTSTTAVNIPLIILYLLIALCGVGWALINANSYPMIVEMANKNNVGKYTGYYYTSSMLAQTITPIAVGLWMSFNTLGLKVLYIYSFITMVIALLIFTFFKENKKIVKKISHGFEAFNDES